MKIILFVITCTIGLCTIVSAQNFDDFVKEEQRREILEQLPENNKDISFEQSNFISAAGGITTIVLMTLWVIFIIYVNKNHFSSYNNSSKQAYIDSDQLSPIELALIIESGSICKKDILISFFDLIEKGALTIDNIRKEEIRIKENTEFFDLDNSEKFLIQWFVHKIGTEGFFSFSKLRQFLQTNSSVVDFDIDYDIWVDEVKDCIKTNVANDEEERWKMICSVVGIIIGLCGIIIYYFTGAIISMLLLAITYMSLRLHEKVSKRAEWAEAIKRGINEKINSGQMQLKSFALFIALDRVNDYLENNNVYKILYYEAVNVLQEAEILCDKLIGNSRFDNLGE